MKTCEYCGKESEKNALTCRECGRPFSVQAPGSEPEPPAAPWRKIAILGGEVEAERVELALNRLEIPHVLVSYRDSALDGLYQNAKGWGHIEAAEEYSEAVLSCLEDLRRSALDDAPPSEPSQG